MVLHAQPFAGQNRDRRTAPDGFGVPTAGKKQPINTPTELKGLDVMMLVSGLVRRLA